MRILPNIRQNGLQRLRSEKDHRLKKFVSLFSCLFKNPNINQTRIAPFAKHPQRLANILDKYTIFTSCKQFYHASYAHKK